MAEGRQLLYIKLSRSEMEHILEILQDEYDTVFEIRDVVIGWEETSERDLYEVNAFTKQIIDKFKRRLEV